MSKIYAYVHFWVGLPTMVNMRFGGSTGSLLKGSEVQGCYSATVQPTLTSSGKSVLTVDKFPDSASVSRYSPFTPSQA